MNQPLTAHQTPSPWQRVLLWQQVLKATTSCYAATHVHVTSWGAHLQCTICSSNTLLMAIRMPGSCAKFPFSDAFFVHINSFFMQLISTRESKFCSLLDNHFNTRKWMLKQLVKPVKPPTAFSFIFARKNQGAKLSRIFYFTNSSTLHSNEQDNTPPRNWTICCFFWCSVWGDVTICQVLQKFSDGIQWFLCVSSWWLKLNQQNKVGHKQTCNLQKYMSPDKKHLQCTVCNVSMFTHNTIQKGKILQG